MYQIARPLFFRTETPMHAGSGSELGHVDLPIQREKHTGFPTVMSSSLKGAFREHIEQRASNQADKIKIQLAFGYDKDGVEKAIDRDSNDPKEVEKEKLRAFFNDSENNDYSGSLAFTDARTLLFPVKSYKGIFALITCPSVIKKLQKELKLFCGLEDNVPNDFEISSNHVAVANKAFLGIQDKVILEEYAFDIDDSKSTETETLAKTLAKLIGLEEKELTNRLAVVPDDVFSDFVQLSTEVITRTKIQNDTGTVQQGALFTEEYLPAESYLYSIIAASNVFQTDKSKKHRAKQFPEAKMDSYTEVLSFFKGKIGEVAQIGGSSTLGKGIVKLFKTQL